MAFSGDRSTHGYLSPPFLPPSWPGAGRHHLCYFPLTYLPPCTLPWHSPENLPQPAAFKRSFLPTNPPNLGHSPGWHCCPYKVTSILEGESQPAQQLASPALSTSLNQLLLWGAGEEGRGCGVCSQQLHLDLEDSQPGGQPYASAGSQQLQTNHNKIIHTGDTTGAPSSGDQELCHWVPQDSFYTKVSLSGLGDS